MYRRSHSPTLPIHETPEQTARINEAAAARWQFTKDILTNIRDEGLQPRSRHTAQSLGCDGAADCQGTVHFVQASPPSYAPLAQELIENLAYKHGGASILSIVLERDGPETTVDERSGQERVRNCSELLDEYSERLNNMVVYLIMPQTKKNSEFDHAGLCFEEGKTRQGIPFSEIYAMIVPRNLVDTVKEIYGDNFKIIEVSSQKKQVTLPSLVSYKISPNSLRGECEQAVETQGLHMPNFAEGLEEAFKLAKAQGYTSLSYHSTRLPTYEDAKKILHEEKPRPAVLHGFNAQREGGSAAEADAVPAAAASASTTFSPSF